VLELTDADVDEMMAVNIKSALYGMQAIAPRYFEGDTRFESETRDRS
jgi:NADP-dependent 3-hydroxy acid dehydrogenase YdfG